MLSINNLSRTLFIYFFHSRSSKNSLSFQTMAARPTSSTSRLVELSKTKNPIVYLRGQKNTTVTLTGPPQQDPFASYSASTSALVQLTTSGKVAFLPYQPGTTSSGGTWTTISKIPVALASSGSSSNGTAISAGDAPADSSNNNNNTTTTTTTKNSSAGALSTRMGDQNIICVLTAVALAVAGVVTL